MVESENLIDMKEGFRSTRFDSRRIQEKAIGEVISMAETVAERAICKLKNVNLLCAKCNYVSNGTMRLTWHGMT